MPFYIMNILESTLYRAVEQVDGLTADQLDKLFIDDDSDDVDNEPELSECNIVLDKLNE